MSDITIPGVNGSLNTASMVSKLMEVERIPLKRKEAELETYEDEKKIWQELTGRLSSLGENAKTLYGADNPFIERVVETSDEKILTATAERGTLEQENEIIVKKKASSDRFLSEPIDDNFEAPSGKYVFTIGDEEVSFNYRGGSIKRLADRINSRGRDLLRTQIVKNTPDTSVMLIESSLEGEKNQLIFQEGAALEFAKQAGIVKQGNPSLQSFIPVPSENSTGAVLNKEGSTLLSPWAKGQIVFDTSPEDNGNIWLEFEVEIKDISKQVVPVNKPVGPDKPSIAGVELEGISIENASSLVHLPEVGESKIQENNIDFNVFSSEYKGKIYYFDSLQDTEEPQTVRVKLSDIGGGVSALNFDNKNTHKEILISKINYYDSEAKREWEPTHPLNKASNSIVEIDGIEIIRESNTIDDVIPGVTLNIKDESEDPVEVKITKDKDLIKDGIIKFVGTFNRIQAELTILTSTDSSVISEIDYFTEDELELARERLGYFQGDSTLIQMKSKLQTILMNPYSTNTEDGFSLLSQIGISTNSGGFSGSFNKSQLRGYIEINEEKLDEALDQNIDGVKELFGIDSDGDLIIDQGAAYSAQNFARAYSTSNGIFSYKISTLNTRMERTKREISSYELKLEDKEAELRNKYTKMEGALNSMQQTSNYLQNFGNSGNK